MPRIPLKTNPRASHSIMHLLIYECVRGAANGMPCFEKSNTRMPFTYRGREQKISSVNLKSETKSILLTITMGRPKENPHLRKITCVLLRGVVEMLAKTFNS